MVWEKASVSVSVKVKTASFSSDQKFWGSHCKSIVKIIFHSSTYVFRLNNKQAVKPCFTKLCCWKWKKHNSQTKQDRFDPELGSCCWREISCHCIAVSKFNELLLCSLRNISSFVNGLLASVNEVSGRLGKCYEICLQACTSVLSQKRIIIILRSSLILYYSK